jgi:excisionase family DNA binding protein
MVQLAPNVPAPIVQPLVLSKAQTARALCLSVRTIHNMIMRGDLPALRIGGRVVVRADALQAFLDSRPAASRV